MKCRSCKNEAVEGKKKCRKCQSKANAHMRKSRYETYWKRVFAKICYECGKRKPMEGLKSCYQCSIKLAEKSKQAKSRRRVRRICTETEVL